MARIEVFPKGDANYTNNKVIVARSYVALDSLGYDPADPVATSHPDDYSPRDRFSDFPIRADNLNF